MWDVVNKSSHLYLSLHDFIPLKPYPLSSKSPSFLILFSWGSSPIPCITPLFSETPLNPFILHQCRDQCCPQCSSASPNPHQGLGLRVPLPTWHTSFCEPRPLQALSSVQAVGIDLVYSFRSLELPYILYPQLPQYSTTTTCCHVPIWRMLQNLFSAFHSMCLDVHKATSSSHQSLAMTFILGLIIMCFCESAISRIE